MTRRDGPELDACADARRSPRSKRTCHRRSAPPGKQAKHSHTASVGRGLLPSSSSPRRRPEPARFELEGTADQSCPARLELPPWLPRSFRGAPEARERQQAQQRPPTPSPATPVAARSPPRPRRPRLLPPAQRAQKNGRPSAATWERRIKSQQQDKLPEVCTRS